MNERRSHLGARLPVVLLLLLLPGTASAHSAVGGVGHFLGGVLHPFTTPTHVLVLLSLGLLAGQHPPLDLKTPLTVFIPVSAMALLLTITGVAKTVYPPILISIALVVGVLVALEKPPPAIGIRLIFGIAALALGFDSAVETGTLPAIAKTLLGTWTGLTLIVWSTAFYVSLFAIKRWQKTGVRVVGSWITAASLMILAFAFRR
jgi:hydrogenase/urease accessory protein HupE